MNYFAALVFGISLCILMIILIYLFSQKNIFCLLGTGLLEGNKYEWNQFIGENVITFRAISDFHLMILQLVSILICIGTYLYIISKNKNKWSRLLICRKFKLVCLSVVSCIAGFLFIACSSDNQESCIFNSLQNMTYETADYSCYVDDSDVSNIRLVIKNKHTGEKNDLIRNPIKSIYREEQLIFGKGSSVYYMVYGLYKSQFHGEDVDKFTIYEVNLDTFEEKILFEQNISRKKDYFLGLNPSENLEWQFLYGASAFFMNHDYLYFAGNELRQIDRITKKVTVMDVPVNRNYSFDGRNIYYLNDKAILCKFDTSSQTYTELPNIVTTYFLLTDIEILFLNRLDQNKIYSMDLYNSQIHKISDHPVLSFTYDENYIYYTGKDSKQYKIIK